MDSNDMSKKQIRSHKITTILLMVCMVVSTVSGIIIVSDANNGKSNISLRTLKRVFGYPGWTSLPLLLSVFFGYLLVKSKGKRFVVAKLVADIINIILRLANIGFTILFIIVGNFIPCMKNDLSEDERRNYHNDDMGIGVYCEVSRIPRNRLEFGLLTLIVFNEFISTILLFMSCVFFCRRCNQNCCCCSAGGNTDNVAHYDQKESFL